MWTFYVNRGQCICSMGVEGKHRPIMEFLPANWAYNLVSSQGFRTFVKLPDHPSIPYYEPFQSDPAPASQSAIQRMVISPSSLKLSEENLLLGLIFEVEYFNVPNDDYAGLVRKLSITNTGPSTQSLQILDGLPLIAPYGLDDFGLKHMRRLFEAFVEVINVEHRVPFYKLKVEPADRPDVVRIKKGNFYLGFGPDSRLVDTIYDPVRVFGTRGDYKHPQAFISTPYDMLSQDQIFENRLPCAMGSFEISLETNRTYIYSSVIGHAGSVEELNTLMPQITQAGYINSKASENREIVTLLSQKSFVCSAEPILDQYARQTFLDNVLRGGFPYTIKGKAGSSVLHLYSRKHGDLERDYNDYRLSPTPFSQGNGNFRDVNQNRRCDLFYNPDVKDENLIRFYNLIQTDGFNPLQIKELRYVVRDAGKLNDILQHYLDPVPQDAADYLSRPYSPGEFLIWLSEHKIHLKGNAEAFIGDLLSISHTEHGTEHGEGFWIDHWTYNLDLLQNYLAVYPELKREILFDKAVFKYYESDHRVAPRKDKYVLWDGKAMQLNAVVKDAEKAELICGRTEEPNYLRTSQGRGEIYYSNLAGKLICLIANKLASLDPEGVGVEMEADKPGWYDALNGLPGLLGSSISESLELKRLILFLLSALEDSPPKQGSIALFSELAGFVNALNDLLSQSLSDYDFWDRASSAKEDYRAQTRLGIDGAVQEMELVDLVPFLRAALSKLDAGIAKAQNPDTGVISTYFIHEVLDYELITRTTTEGKTETKCNQRGFPCYRPLAFRQKRLPLFLEGPVHYLRCAPDQRSALGMAESVCASGLYDTKLKMYKVNESLADQAPEIGRARTFSPGWFENESIWLHMEYKYILELLRNGLYDRFYRDFYSVLIPFMDPQVYGRSTLENSSFIVSSANPDPSLHGNGFVARLSGATAEFVHILHLMTVGEAPFGLDSKGNLILSFKPALSESLFTREEQIHTLYLAGQSRQISFPRDSFSFFFLSDTLVTYHNPARKDCFGPAPATIVAWSLVDTEAKEYQVEGSILPTELALMVRNQKISKIDIQLA